MHRLKSFAWLLLFSGVVVILQSCGGADQGDAESSEFTTEPTVRILPTLPPTTVEPLQPTFTPADPAAQPGDSLTPFPTLESSTLGATPEPTADLNQAVLRLVYEVPAIGLERTLEANLAGKLTLTDVTRDNVVTVSNGQRFLTEITSAIQANRELFEEVPADCDLCVIIGYDLPLSNESARGTLPDPTLQASLQNLFANRLGPHFPLGTIIGHHRSASGYTVAQTAALTADGQLFQWIAADSQVNVSVQAIPDQATIERYSAELTKFNGVDLITKCPNFPNEVVVFDGAAVNLRCPELSLAQSLIEPYSIASEYSQALLADPRNLDIPITSLPFDSVLYYERRDGSTLTIFEDGAVTATFPVTPTEPITGTETITPTVLPPDVVVSSIPEGEIEPLLIPLLASDVIPRGVTASVTLEQTEFEELILIRGTDGVYEFAWADGVGQELLPGIQILDLLLDELRPDQ